ncbi:MAG: hypothetical protein KDA80_09815, partial [Planctomycetaceae bacterium]|nr:hypothetical protein [Planctomycetaceae bacterium]
MHSVPHPPRRGSLTRRLLGSLGLVLAFVVVILVFQKPPAPDDGVVDPSPDDANTGSEARAEQELVDIIERMHPTRLGISTDPASLTDELNRWFSKYSLDEQVPELVKDEELRASVLSEELQERIRAEAFTSADVQMISRAFLCREISDWVCRSARTDGERLMALFNFVCDTIVEDPGDSKSELPLTPYESLLFGMGNAEDRAWAMASLVQQPPMSMDAVLIEPDSPDQTNNWLLGVLGTDGTVWLFDLRDGVAIPPPTDPQGSPVVSQPGTLKDVLDNPGLLTRLDVPGMPYPLTSESLKNARIRVIASPEQFAPRIASLRFLLPAEIGFEIYRGFGE